MCVVSNVHDYFRQPSGVPWQWPHVTPNPYGVTIRKKVIVDGREWDRETLDKLKEAMRLLGEVDAALGEPDCESEDKAEWMREVERRLAELEKPDA